MFKCICLDGESHTCQLKKQLQSSHLVFGWSLDAMENDGEPLFAMKWKDWWTNKSVVLPSSFTVGNM